MLRSIVHLDADAFFASVEQAADPRLRGKPVAVGGDKRGIIASASYEARRLGIYTPMPTARARKLCPKLIILPGDFEKYETFSRWMFSYAYDFTPEVEISSIDEGYFDLSGARKSPVSIAEAIRRAIREALKISVSEGIGANKLVSQIASKLNKPAAFAQVPAGGEKQFLHPLPNRWLPGVGPKTATHLNAAGLALIGQVAATPLDLLHLLLGNPARSLKEFANGVDERPIVPVSEPAKSYSQQETFAADTTDEDYVEALLHRMADHLMAKARADGKSIRTVTVKVRYNDMAEDQCGESLPEPTDLESDVYPRLRPMLRRAWARRVSLRMVSLKFSNLYEGFFRAELPLERAAQQHDARRRLALVVDELRKARGTYVVLRGHDLVLRDAAGEAKKAGPPLPGGKAIAGRSAGVLTRSGSGRQKQFSTARPSGRAAGEDARAPFRPQARPVAAKPAIPLHVHSCYSFLDSSLSIEAIVELAKQHELPAIALTDRENLHGAVEFVQAARAAGVQPILGAEIQAGGAPLRLYVQNAAGYANLCRILTEVAQASLPAGSAGIPARSQTDGKNASPARSLETCPTGGLLAVSPQPQFARLFPGRFYLEVSSREALRKLDGVSGLPLVAALPIHYATPADRLKYDVVQSIRTLTLLRQEHPEKRLGGEFHFPTPRAMQELFGSRPELLAHSREIAERCSGFGFPFGKPQFPAFRPPDASPPKEFLRQLVWAGAQRRYGGDVSNSKSRIPNLKSQIEEELAIISAVGYEEYFLVVWDLLQECRRRGIEWITRGSAADSLVCYCLGISDVCPIRFELYFRRFLNQDRMQLNKLPDIDVDFPHDRKDDVIDLVFEKYGPERAAVVGGFSTYQARGAVADVAKVLGVSEHQIRRFTEHFPYAGAEDVAAALRQSQECRDLPLDEDPYATALRLAGFLDGFPRYPKMHPCGVVLSRQLMRELTPTFLSSKGYPTTHYDMDAVEAIGLVKIDILAQGGLAAMRDVKATLEQRGLGVDLNQFTVTRAVEGQAGVKVSRCESGNSTPAHLPTCSPALPDAAGPWNDPAVWELIAGGNARAVHHIESPAMIGLCRMCNVREIDGLIAIVSVIRPGAANEQKKVRFTRRYQGLEPVTYPHPSLEPHLKSTFGLVVYEEHVLQICEAFAGLPAGRADVLRRALGKRKQAVIDQIRGEFFAAARARGHGEAKIAEVWELVSGFAGYAFCKAHSTAYGVEAYQSAWLKKYFPAEFMAAVLSNGKGFYHPIVYVLECWRLGIPLLPPWINEPGPHFGVKAEGRMKNEEAKAGGGAAGIHPMPCPPPAAFIRVPVARVKGLSGRTAERILGERARGPFESLRDFYRRVGPLPEEMEALIRVGAFDEFGQSRTAQFWEWQFFQRAFGGDASGQGWLLPLPAAGCPPEVREPGRRERLQWEAELLDFPVSGHPLELHEDIAWETYCPVARLGEYAGKEVVTCGLVIEQRLHHQVTGEPMKFLTLADWTGMVETELFAPTYRSYGLATVRYPVLEVTARVEPFENGRGFSLRVLRAGKPRLRQPDRVA